MLSHHDFFSHDAGRRAIAVDSQEAFAHNVVVHTIGVLLTLDWNGDVQVLEQVLFAVFKDPPDVIHRTATSLASAFVESDLVRVHMISAVGIGQAA